MRRNVSQVLDIDVTCIVAMMVVPKPRRFTRSGTVCVLICALLVFSCRYTDRRPYVEVHLVNDLGFNVSTFGCSQVTSVEANRVKVIHATSGTCSILRRGHIGCLATIIWRLRRKQFLFL